MLPPTLKQIERNLKKIKRAIRFQQSKLKDDESNPTIIKLQGMEARLRENLEKTTNPKNALRCALPLKKQRELGLIPKL